MTNYVDVFNSDTVPPAGLGYQALNFAGATNPTYWPYNYNGTGITISKIIDATPGSGATIQLPDATQVSGGEDILIFNVGSNTLTIQNFGAGAVTTVAAGTAKFLYLKDNTTQNGTWGVVTYGTGTSAADSSALAGYGLTALGGTQLNLGLVTVASSSFPITLDTTYRSKILNITSGTGTINLPTVASLGANAGTYFVSVKNSGSGTLTVTTTDSKNVDGNLTFTMRRLESAFFICDGTNWQTIGYGRSVQGYTLLTKTISGSTSLTSSESQNQLITLTGSPAADFTLTMTGAVAIWYFTNNTGKTATVTTGSGTTVLVYAGWSVTLRCDGTNITNANAYTAVGAINENLLMNAGMNINQRLQSSSMVAPHFIADRWYAYSSTASANLQAIASGTFGGTGQLAVISRTASTNTTGTVAMAYSFSFEEMNRLVYYASQAQLMGLPTTYTLSFLADNYLGANATVGVGIYTDTSGNYSSLTLAQKIATGSSTGWSSMTTQLSSSVPINGNTIRYSYTINVPNTFIQSMGLAIWATFTGTAGGSNEQLRFYAIKLEYGSTATPFLVREINSELAACQAYYEKSFLYFSVPQTALGLGTGEFHFAQAVGATAAQGQITIPYKRSKAYSGGRAPVVTLYNPVSANSQIRNSTTNADWTGSTATVAAGSLYGLEINGTSPGGSAAGNSACVHWTADFET